MERRGCSRGDSVRRAEAEEAEWNVRSTQQSPRLVRRRRKAGWEARVGEYECVRPAEVLMLQSKSRLQDPSVRLSSGPRARNEATQRRRCGMQVQWLTWMAIRAHRAGSIVSYCGWCLWSRRGHTAGGGHPYQYKYS